MKSIRFTSTRLLPQGKKGILTPDSDGYYEFPVGGLNAFNSAGEYYTLQGAEDLFKSSSILMRRINKGVLKSELGHPKKQPGQSEDSYLERILTIEETNVCCHIRELRLDYEFGGRNPQFKNPKLVAIMARIKPSGPHGASLAASLLNPSENVGFSIRGLTNNYYERGQCYRVLTTIVTFDQVNEQGITMANKWDSPSLESVSETKVTEKQLRRIVDSRELVAMESTRELALDALRKVSVSELPIIPLYTRW